MRRPFMLLVLVLAACSAAPSTAPTCAQVSAELISSLQPIIREWNDRVNLPGTPSQTLPSPDANTVRLVELRRQARSLSAPECARRTYNFYIESMDEMIHAYSGRREPTFQIALYNAADRMNTAAAALDNLAKGIEPGTALTRAELIRVYPNITFADRTLSDGRILFSGRGPDFSVDAIGTAKDLNEVLIIVHEPALLQTAATSLAPAWSDYDAWITANVTPSMSERASIITAGSRLVTVRRLGGSYLMAVYFL